jgi:hypothetical protein
MLVVAVQGQKVLNVSKQNQQLQEMLWLLQKKSGFLLKFFV